MGRAYQNRKESIAKTSDAQAKVYSKYGRVIYMCAKAGGLDPVGNQLLRGLIDRAKKDGDSVGGEFEVLVQGTPAGLGSYTHWDRRLDGQLAQALMSIHAVKAVAVGAGFDAGATRGSAFHDEILWSDSDGLARPTNRAGGIEGGVTNGELIRARAIVKPIPTLLIPLRSVDLGTREAKKASVERSDTCVVPAAGVVGEAMVAWIVADALLDKLGGDSLDELLEHLRVTREQQQALTRGVEE